MVGFTRLNIRTQDSPPQFDDDEESEDSDHTNTQPQFAAFVSKDSQEFSAEIGESCHEWFGKLQVCCKMIVAEVSVQKLISDSVNGFEMAWLHGTAFELGPQ